MPFLREEVFRKLGEFNYATVVTIARYKLASRTMLFGFKPDHTIYLLTNVNTEKLNDIDYSPKGLVHLSKIEENLSDSFDISIPGQFEKIPAGDPEYADGIAVLSEKNEMISDIVNSPMQKDYQLLKFVFKEIYAYTYFQIINGENKTLIKV